MCVLVSESRRDKPTVPSRHPPSQAQLLEQSPPRSRMVCVGVGGVTASPPSAGFSGV